MSLTVIFRLLDMKEGKATWASLGKGECFGQCNKDSLLDQDLVGLLYLVLGLSVDFLVKSSVHRKPK